EMCDRQEVAEAAVYKELQKVRSYANVPFRSERGERGTISLISDQAWFFAEFHKNVLRALGERVGFLLETLRRKQRESFLLGVSPQLSQISDLNDVGTVLATEIKRFAETTRAEFASLYLWEEERQRHVLRAQFGWKQPEWVNAACYTREDFWA